MGDASSIVPILPLASPRLPLLLLSLITLVGSGCAGTDGPARSTGPVDTSTLLRVLVPPDAPAAELLTRLGTAVRERWHATGTCYVLLGDGPIETVPVILGSEGAALEGRAFCNEATLRPLVADRPLAVEEWRLDASRRAVAKILYHGAAGSPATERPAQAMTGAQGPAREMLAHLGKVSRVARVVLVFEGAR